jgi:hypothetical protein
MPSKQAATETQNMPVAGSTAGNSKMIMAVVAIIVIVAISLVAVLLISQNNKSDSDKNEDDSEEKSNDSDERSDDSEENSTSKDIDEDIKEEFVKVGQKMEEQKTITLAFENMPGIEGEAKVVIDSESEIIYFEGSGQEIYFTKDAVFVGYAGEWIKTTSASEAGFGDFLEGIGSMVFEDGLAKNTDLNSVEKLDDQDCKYLDGDCMAYKFITDTEESTVLVNKKSKLVDSIESDEGFIASFAYSKDKIELPAETEDAIDSSEFGATEE